MAKVFRTDHLNPRLASDTDPLAFAVNFPQERQGKVNIHPLFGAILLGKMCGDIFATFGTFGDVFHIDPLMVTGFRVHRLVAPGWWHAMR